MDVALKRAYEPAADSDGYRVLVDGCGREACHASGPIWTSGRVLRVRAVYRVAHDAGGC